MYGDHDRLSERKKMILRAIVDAHINYGEPVGSKFLTVNNNIAFSPATVRNEMAELEEMGFLEQPHTSAGRIPSELGYRFYVDSLMESYRLTKDELEQLNNLKRIKESELDSLIERAGKLISHITNYTSLAARPKPKAAVITRFNTLFVDSHTFALLMISDNGMAKTKLIRTAYEIDPVLTDRLSGVLNRCVAGVNVENIPYSIIVEMEKSLAGYESLVNPIMKCVYDTVSEIDKGDIKIEGVNRLLEFPEYSDLSELHGLIGMLEQKDDILDIISNSEKDTVNILIGKENAVDIMSKSTLIFKTVTSGDKVIGAIGVLGPRRMDYSKVITILDLLTDGISEIYSKNAGELPDKNNGGKND